MVRHTFQSFFVSSRAKPTLMTNGLNRAQLTEGTTFQEGLLFGADLYYFIFGSQGCCCLFFHLLDTSGPVDQCSQISNLPGMRRVQSHKSMKAYHTIRQKTCLSRLRYRQTISHYLYLVHFWKLSDTSQLESSLRRPTSSRRPGFLAGT